MTKYILFIIAMTFAVACGSSSSSDASPGKTIATGPAGNLTVTLTNPTGVLRKGRQEFIMTFTDASGKTVDVGAAALNFRMAAMGTMAEMNNAATFTTTSTPGVYKGVVDLDMAGEWQAQITYEGTGGKGRGNLPITAQ